MKATKLDEFVFFLRSEVLGTVISIQNDKKLVYWQGNFLYCFLYIFKPLCEIFCVNEFTNPSVHHYYRPHGFGKSLLGSRLQNTLPRRASQAKTHGKMRAGSVCFSLEPRTVFRSPWALYNSTRIRIKLY